MRILGITLPEHKRMEYALTALYGIGTTSARKILKEAKVSIDTKAKDLKESDEQAIRTIIERDYKIEGDLKRIVQANIKRLKDIKTYRGSRHAKHLPSRGQRTKTNSRTVRGNVRKTMGSGRRKESKT
jgi:small subunit ribosomal protein S13